MIACAQIQEFVSCCSTSKKEYNMKKFLLLAGVACLFSTAANAGVSQYVAARASYDFNRVKVKAADADGIERSKVNKELISPHFAYGVRSGYVRGELELNFSHPIKANRDDYKMNLKKYSAMANVYFDYLTCTPWTPYVGAGLGYAWLKDSGITNKSVYNLAWQAMAGIAYDINNRWTVDAGYRYADLGRIRKNFGDHKVKTTVRDHEIMLGIRYNF
jgi:opacity protein-like surface antigen